jgi:TonB family protein
MAALSTAHAADAPATAAAQTPDQTAPAAPVAQTDAIQPTSVSPSPTPLQASEKAEPVDIEVFQGAKILSGPGESSYPASEMNHGREGWVRLNMMIDPKGKPYEVMIMDSSGNPAFEKAALKAINLVSFAPARRGDTPVDSSLTFKFKFYMGDFGKGASPSFAANYGKFTKAITAGDKATADTMLKAKNLYEEAFEHYSRYFYYTKWGQPAEQLRELSLAIAGEKRPEYLPKKTFVHALTARFVLQAKGGDYGDALATWAILEPIASKGERAPLAPVADQIKALQHGTQPLRYAALIGETHSWSGYLLRDRFSIDVTSGKVSEIKLRCEKQYLFFKYEPGVEYSIGRKKDQCHMEVVGNQGTEFVLIQ